MTSARRTEVLIIGAGLAGFCAAVRAAELGLEVTLLEKSALDPSLSNSRASSGGVHAALLSLNAPPDTIVEKIMQDTDGIARSDVVGAFAKDAHSAMQWLIGQGIAVAKTGPDPVHDFVLAPLAEHPNGLQWDGGGPDLALRQLKRRFLELGGTYRNRHRATALLISNDRVVGVKVVTPDSSARALEGGAVVLADGGFQANSEMVNRYIGPNVFQRIKLCAVDTGTGDGIQMAEAAGAKLIQMDAFYGHSFSLDSLHNDHLWPYPIFDGVIAASALVWRHTGERFLDEGMGGIAIANAIARSADPQAAVLICDDDAWNGPGADIAGPTPPNPNLIRNAGTLHTADSIDTLGRKAGIDPNRLSATIAHYNQDLQSNRRRLPVPRTGEARPIERPPFHAVPIVPGITYTMGGILINGEGQVLDQHEQPIPGLWAAGVTAGGLEGGPRLGYAGGLSQGLVFGKRAAESVRRMLHG
jgi:fumarate reductase flavoprotein subunit